MIYVNVHIHWRRSIEGFGHCGKRVHESAGGTVLNRLFFLF